MRKFFDTGSDPITHRIAALVLLGATWCTPSSAASALEGILSCRQITDPAARLSCFDREAAVLGVGSQAPAPNRETMPSSIAVKPDHPAIAAPPAPALDPEQQFGLPEKAVVAREVAAGTRSTDATKIHAQLATISEAADRRLVFVLDNAQVWRQLQAEGDMLAKPGDEITISRGVFNSYYMQFKSGRGCKVTRLR